MNNIKHRLNFNLISGFTYVDGCFYINIYITKTLKVDYGIITQIILNQH